MRERIPIGNLLLEVLDGWRFSLRDGGIAGRWGDDPGVLRMLTFPCEELKQPVTHEACFDIVTRAAETVGIQPFAMQLMESVCGPFGAMSFYRDRDFVRLWYCNRPVGLIIGMFAYPVEQSGTQAWKMMTNQCGRLVLSAVFNRPAWGGDDPLTRILLTEMATAEEPAPGPAIQLPSTPPQPAE